MIAPAAAQGTTKYRYWQDLSVSGPFPGQISLAVAYEDSHGNHKFTPRYAAAYHLQLQTNCDPGSLAAGGTRYSKYNYFKEGLRKGRFAHRFEDQAEQPQLAPLRGDLNGTVLKRLKRGKRVTRTARVNGAFDIERWDPYPFTLNCISSGSYSATPCKRRMSPWAPKFSHWKHWNVPVCSMDPW